MKLGFTGTQNGMTPPQLLKVAQFIIANKLSESHSGDCIGADKEFLTLVQMGNKNKNFNHIKTIGHIPDNDSKRAFGAYDEERIPKSYLDRNHDIVDESDTVIATPFEKDEQLRSGTWATIRYAKKQGKPVTIFLPDGTIQCFNQKKSSEEWSK